jgi:hypothetical protein
MSLGFQIEIAKNLNTAERKLAVEFAHKWTQEVLKNGLSWKNETRGGWKSFYKRGVAGLRIPKADGLYFRRASKSRRIFQIVRGTDLNISPQIRRWGDEHSGVLGTKCMCPDHEGGLKVNNKYGDIPTEVYVRVGEIKG